MPAEDSFLDFHKRLRESDVAAASEVFLRYRERLVRLAAPKLAGILRQKVDAEDIVQSAFRSFLRAESEKQFSLDGWNDLWSLLATITLRKCRYQVRQFLTAKRDVRREQTTGESEDATGWQAIASEPTPAEAAEFADLLTRLLDGLDERARKIVQFSLDGLSAAEMAEHVGLTDRSVYRQMERIRARLEDLDLKENTE